MLNHIVIMGRLTRDPELRRTQNGTAVTTISVAVERDYQSRETQERQTDFIDVVAWRSTAEFISKYFTKGKMIVVEGSLQSRKWQDKNGQNRVSWEIQANNVYFGESKRDNQGGGSDYAAPPYGSQPYNQSYTAPAQSYAAPTGGGFAEIEEDGELPF